MERKRGLTTSDVEDCYVRILEYIGENPEREGLLKTPARAVKALRELTGGYTQDPAAILGTTFAVDCDEMVVVQGIEYWSLCEHHLLPFKGKVSVAYLPGDEVVGLSKIPRLVECFARRLQVQERLTNQIAESIQEVLAPLGVGVVVSGEHQCCSMRGGKKPVIMKTSALLGRFREPEVRAEFLTLANA